MAAQGVSPRAPSQVLRRLHLRYDGTDTALMVRRTARPSDGPTGVRDRAPPALRLRHPRQGHHRRGGLGRGRSARTSKPSADSPARRACDDAAAFRRLATRWTHVMAGDAARRARVPARRPAHRASASTARPSSPKPTAPPSSSRAGGAVTATQRPSGADAACVPRPERVAVGTDADPVMLEVFNNLFMSIAEQMGAALENTAYSVNIKERLDFSCAVFDRQAAS